MFKRVLAAVAAVTLVGGLGATAALADTSGTPNDTLTHAALAPAAASASLGQNPSTTLAGAVAGQVVHVHAEGDAGKFFGVTVARLCRDGLSITTSAQLSPTSFGNCIAAPLPNGGGDASVGPVSAAPTNTSVDFDFKLGTGTETSHPGPGTAITCDDANPCDLWLQESVDSGTYGTANIFKHYDITFAGNPGAPGVAITPGNGQLTVNVTAPANTGNASITSYAATLAPGGTVQTITSPATSTVFSGLTNFTSYTVAVTAKNTASDGTTQFTGPSASASGTPVPPAPPAPTGVAGDAKVTLSLSAPSGPAPDSYSIEAHPATGSDLTQTHAYAGNPTQHVFTGLTNGVVYTFRYRAVYSGTPGTFSAYSAPITPNAQLITQTITVTRPVGALVLTQVCGPTGSPTAPTYSGGPDPLYSQYPYPVDGNGDSTANYPTDCGVNLGTAHLVTSGAGKGQFFEATGALKQVTIVDTRDGDVGFDVSGQMGSFTSGANSFSGSQLGWTPATTDTASYVDSSGTNYDQTVAAGPVVAPNTPNATGLGSGRVGAHANSGQGLGIATLDAALKLWIPLPNNAGTYTGVLTISAI